MAHAHVVAAAICIAAMTAAACGSSSSATSPAAPSAVSGVGSMDTAAATGDTSVSGAVQRLAGTCPDLTFSVNGAVVRTTAETRYESGSCALVRVGSQVGASGTQRGTTLIAARLRVSASQR